MKNIYKTLLSCAALLAVMLPHPAANACSVCMGASDSALAPAVNDAIFFMFGAIGLVLACIAGFIFQLARRARRNP